MAQESSFIPSGMAISRRLSQPLKATLAFRKDAGSAAFSNILQLWNAWNSIVSTPSGMAISRKDPQPAKASSPMVFKDAGRRACCSPPQPQNAYREICSTPSGMLISRRESQNAKAPPRFL